MARHFLSSLARAKNERELRMARLFIENIFMHYVYIIQSVNFPEKIYTGLSKNINHRLEGHNNGRSKHTSKFKPWRIIYYCAFNDKDKALDFERYLKTASGIAFRNKRLI